MWLISFESKHSNDYTLFKASKLTAVKLLLKTVCVRNVLT